ncbi:MAG: aminodeoxychorismate synthase component 1 [Plesiomonas sp.]|uniref:aminodeoxychorismate synthase component 1 n=1 Tax=Plesiomonas sp. TaxID=2486279 RepID=UPI003F2E559B
MFINNNRFPACLALEYHTECVLTLFAPLATLPWAMLLTSGHSTHQHNRYDILVADPLATLETYGNDTVVEMNNQQSVHCDDPLQVLDDIQQRCLPKLKSHPTLPFLGGAVGAFSYDLGRRFEILSKNDDAEMTLPDMAVGIYDWALIADHLQQTLTLFSHQDVQARYQWLLKQTKCQQNQASSLSLTTIAETFALTADWQANMTRAEYQRKFDAVQAYLAAGDCYQVNLAQRFSAPYTGSEWEAFLRLNQHNQAPFSAFIRLKQGALLSVSPERFLAVSGTKVVTRPIKGTRPRNTDPILDRAEAAALAMSEKDQSENLMIVDLMRNDIGRVAKAGSVTVPELFVIESFPAVHHLVSTVQAELEETQRNTDLLRACFPGGSITGAPKIRAMQIIDELEPQRRSFYCGSIGYLSCCGRMDTSITIRTLVANQGKLHCWAGGGIVADSCADDEYQETLDKVGRILPILAETT